MIRKLIFAYSFPIFAMQLFAMPSDIDFLEYGIHTPNTNRYFNRFDTTTFDAFNIPMEYIATLETEGRLIDVDTTRWKYLTNQFDNGYEFIPILRKMLADADVPQEFLFLAMVESEFKSQALSSKKAAGIWQIMPTTAKELGLIIDDFIDERQDPIKSTQAAIRYLQYLYKATGKWYLAAMAYNCGLGRLSRAIRDAQSDSISVLLDEEQQFLPLETRNYLRKIMSISLAFSNAHELKLADREYMLNRGAGDSLVVVNVKAGNSLANIAKGANMKVEDLRSYNRHFKYDFVPFSQKEYQVYLPYDRLSYFKQHFKNAPDARPPFTIYKVRKGDNLSSIARRYNTSVDKIKQINGLKSNMLMPHQTLKLPMNPLLYNATANTKQNTIKQTTRS